MRELYNQYKTSIVQENQAVYKNYLILDAALWDVEIEPAFEFGNKYCCLFATRGAEDELNNVAPYLFEYEGNDELSTWIKHKETKGKRVLHLVSSLSLEQLRKHLRRFLRVKKEDGTYIYFRFYDSYVVNAVFPNLSKEQYLEFFEKIDYLIADDIRVNMRYSFHLSHENILQIEHKSLDYVDDNR